jgi:hypothetical protein
MAGMLQIIAIPDPTKPELAADGLERETTRVRNRAPGLGYRLIAGYTSLADLLTKIRQLLTDEQACLSILEIDAHGNPGLCNGLTSANVAQFGTDLETLNLCDAVSIFLSGCNTGVTNRNDAMRRSLAQVLSASTPRVDPDNVQVTVFGSVGYLSGTNAEGNAKCRTSCTTGTGSKKQFYSPYPPSEDGTQPGTQAGDGAAAYRAFREGRPV